SLEAAPIGSPIKRERSEIRRRARLLAYHTHDDRPAAHAVRRQHGAMPSVRQRDEAGRFATDADGISDEAHRRRPQWLDNNVLLVHADDREAEGDSLVMPDRDAWACRLAGADHVPSRRDQVRDVADAGIRDRPMGIIGEHRLAARRLLAAYRPVIRAFYPVERDVVIDLFHSAEQALIQTRELETGGGIGGTMRIGVDQLISGLRANDTDQSRVATSTP